MSMERWCSHLQPRTAKISRWIFSDFVKWLKAQDCVFRGMGPDELVAWQRGHAGDYGLLDVVQDYIRPKEGTFEYKKRCYGAIRSFFLHNRCELPRDASFRVQGTRPGVRGSFDVDTFRRVLAACNPLYRCIFICMFQGGLGVEELLNMDRLGYEYVSGQVDERFIRVDLPGRKKLKYRKPYYTFLGMDAISALKVWFKERPKRSGNRVFVSQFNEAINYNSMQNYWLRKLDSLGIIDKKRNGNSGNRYGKNLHEIRDLFRTRWHKSGADPLVAEFCMGHEVDPLGYNKAMEDVEYVRSEYRKAERWLNVLTMDPSKVAVEELDKVREEQEETRRTMEEIKEMLKLYGLTEKTRE